VLGDYELILDCQPDDVMVLALLVRCVVGPWGCAAIRSTCCCTALPAALLPLFFPRRQQPMLSMSRLLLDVVPVFLVLARMGANRWFDRCCPFRSSRCSAACGAVSSPTPGRSDGAGQAIQSLVHEDQ
jgi:hypothetical protein